MSLEPTTIYGDRLFYKPDEHTAIEMRESGLTTKISSNINTTGAQEPTRKKSTGDLPTWMTLHKARRFMVSDTYFKGITSK